RRIGVHDGLGCGLAGRIEIVGLDRATLVQRRVAASINAARGRVDKGTCTGAAGEVEQVRGRGGVDRKDIGGLLGEGAKLSRLRQVDDRIDRGRQPRRVERLREVL